MREHGYYFIKIDEDSSWEPALWQEKGGYKGGNWHGNWRIPFTGGYFDAPRFDNGFYAIDENKIIEPN